MNLYRPLDKKCVQCLACAHYCKIAAGATGICGVRLNDGGELKLLVYGRPCAVNIDPIEKKPLYHFLPGTEILSLGTFGCNFRCDFCQNWDISQMTRQGSGLKNDWEKLLARLDELSPAQAADLAIARHCPSIAYTYNEPIIWSEYAVDIAKEAKTRGLKNVFVSNGYFTPESLEYVAPYLDAVNVDLKSFSEDFYRRACGAKLAPVLDGIRALRGQGVLVELTTLVIPGLNDSEEELRQIAEFIAGLDKNIPWHISAFHGAYKLAEREPTGWSSLERAYQIGKDAGLRFVYVGNARSDARSQTRCPDCDELLIERGYMSVKKNYLRAGQCGKCGARIAGIF